MASKFGKWWYRNVTQPFNNWMWGEGNWEGKNFGEIMNTDISMGGLFDDWTTEGVGNLMNDLSGKTGEIYLNDQIADENAAVAHERQKELMALEAQYNSPVYKSNELGKAGLNPVLASGVNNSVSGATAQMSHPNGGSASVNPIQSFMNILGAKEHLRGMKLDNDMKAQDLYEKQDSYGVRWLGMQADSTLKLSNAQKAMDEAQMLQYEVSWLRKSEDERLAVIKSEKNKNDAIAKYNRMSAKEKELTNTQLDSWIDKYMDASQKAELDKKLAEAESIEDANARANAVFWTKVVALVAGGACMFIPGAQGLGVGLLASTIGWNSSAQIGGYFSK